MPESIKPSPFEVVSIAALLALRDRRSSESPLVNYIPEAISLIKAAAEYLEQPSEAQEHEKFLGTLGYKAYSFAEALRPIAAPAKDKKKASTMVGSITTQQGLIKAIRRIFPPDVAKVTEKRGTLYQPQIQAILSDQKLRNKTRTEAATASRLKKSTVK